jgi:YfiH family protein
MSEVRAIGVEFPRSGIRAITTTRQGGVSTGAFDSWNLAEHVGDASDAVAENRRRLLAPLPEALRICWLKQVHGTRVVHAADGLAEEADAAWSDDPAWACAVMTADCLPVVFAANDGSCVAAAHAGWRGLAAGVLSATLDALPVAADDVSVWLGPAIGPSAFEVGGEVREAFLESLGDSASACFTPQPAADKWLCDLYALARLELNARGVSEIAGGNRCTHTEADTFFSYRRDGETGRMATIVWVPER